MGKKQELKEELKRDCRIQGRKEKNKKKQKKIGRCCHHKDQTTRVVYNGKRKTGTEHVKRNWNIPVEIWLKNPKRIEI
jgi:hypothetical protein